MEQGEPKATDEFERLGEPVEDPKVRVRKGIRFVDEMESGKPFGLVGAAGEAPPDQAVPEEERIRRELKPCF